MKNTKILLALMTIIAGCYSSTSFGQDVVTHTITLHVDTDKLTKGNEEKDCYFTVSEGTTVLNDGVKSFTIHVDIDSEIIWEGISESASKPAVDIKKIKYHKGTKIFKDKDLSGEKKVKGKVLYNTKDEEDFEYHIKFKVAGKTDNYSIDPKVKVGK